MDTVQLCSLKEVIYLILNYMGGCTFKLITAQRYVLLNDHNFQFSLLLMLLEDFKKNTVSMAEKSENIP